MKNLLITGGCGFIGSNLVRTLLSQPGFTGRIVNLDLLTYAGNPDNLRDVAARHPERYCFERGDVADPVHVGRILDAYDIDTVCHLAAESHVDRSISDPGVFIHTNIGGTHNLLEQCRQRADRIRLFHHVSTDEVYGSLGSTGSFSEDSPYRPNSPYAASKAASDHLVRAYHRTYGLPATISNCSNNYGPFQFPEKLIPLMILNSLASRPLPVYGDGLQVRDWLHVEDHCTAIWRILTSGEAGRTYNVGGCAERANLEVVRSIVDLVDEMAPPASGGSRRHLIRRVADRPGHDRRYAVDCRRIRRELAWEPAHDFEAGLRQTVRWYLEHGTWVTRVQDNSYRPSAVPSALAIDRREVA